MTNLANNIVPLEHCGETSQCGGKAKVLSRLQKMGYNVLPGFVLLNSLLEDHLQGVNTKTLSPEEIRNAILTKPVNATLYTELGHWFNRLPKPLIVRSSAVGEDSNTHSLAGLLESTSDINTFDELLSAIKVTWSSLWSDRSISYQECLNISINKIGVLVQHQITPKVSGVLFSNIDDVLVIEYCTGSSSKLMSGEITPNQVLIDARTGTIIERLHDDLTLAVCHELFSEGKQLQILFGNPVDVEWGIDTDNTIYIFQVRPIVNKH